MSDAPPPVQSECLTQRDAAPLTAADIDRVLADFRGWLDELLSGGHSLPTSEPPPEPIDLHTLAAQFVALRHEVNLQTRATRTAIEQNAKLIEQRTTPDETLRQLLKTIIDVGDALTLAWREVEKVRSAVEPLLADLTAAHARPRGLAARLFGSGATADPRSTQAAERIRPLLASLADGYALSLRRIERVLPEFGLEPIATLGQPFDPNTMEVVEVAAGGPSGTVLNEVRRGYRWNGTVFRYAQVTVAR